MTQPQQELEMLKQVVGDLRHAYLNLVQGRVAEAAQREFADGLIAVQIQRLEALIATKEELVTESTPPPLSA
jgi:hypothetical protein